MKNKQEMIWMMRVLGETDVPTFLCMTHWLQPSCV
jgi:hypothetical protein